MPFRAEIVDYAFDHVSRPLLAKVISAAAGIGSVASFVLTFLGQIDKGFGLASGTAGGLIAALLTGRALRIYRNPTVTTASHP